MNPFISNLDPYQFAKTTQGTALQDQFNAQALQQMGQLAGQAGQSPKTGGSNPLALANMLKKMGNATQLSDAQKYEINALGSNSWNPMSNYNLGTNGWGNYGE